VPDGRGRSPPRSTSSRATASTPFVDDPGVRPVLRRSARDEPTDSRHSSPRFPFTGILRHGGAEPEPRSRASGQTRGDMTARSLSARAEPDPDVVKADRRRGGPSGMSGDAGLCYVISSMPLHGAPVPGPGGRSPRLRTKGDRPGRKQVRRSRGRSEGGAAHRRSPGGRSAPPRSRPREAAILRFPLNPDPGEAP
jgi:hypothetical protein